MQCYFLIIQQFIRFKWRVSFILLWLELNASRRLPNPHFFFRRKCNAWNAYEISVSFMNNYFLFFVTLVIPQEKLLDISFKWIFTSFYVNFFTFYYKNMARFDVKKTDFKFSLFHLFFVAWNTCSSVYRLPITSGVNVSYSWNNHKKILSRFTWLWIVLRTRVSFVNFYEQQFLQLGPFISRHQSHYG